MLRFGSSDYVYHQEGAPGGIGEGECTGEDTSDAPPAGFAAAQREQDKSASAGLEAAWW